MGQTPGGAALEDGLEVASAGCQFQGLDWAFMRSTADEPPRAGSLEKQGRGTGPTGRGAAGPVLSPGPQLEVPARDGGSRSHSCRGVTPSKKSGEHSQSGRADCQEEDEEGLVLGREEELCTCRAGRQPAGGGEEAAREAPSFPSESESGSGAHSGQASRRTELPPRSTRRPSRCPGMPAPRCVLLLLLGAALRSCSAPDPEPSPARLDCWFVEEVGGGGGSVMPSALRQSSALLLLPPPGRRLEGARLESELPPEVEPRLAFQFLDPSGTLWGGGDPRQASSCEINAYAPQEAHVRWAAGLAGQGGCPRTLERGRWFIATLQSPAGGFGVSSILNAEESSSSWKLDSGVTTATAVLSVFTRTPRLQSRLGQAVLLDCGFSAPAVPFSVEWRHQHRGAGRVVLAYNGAARQILVAEEGVDLFLDPGGSNVSLHLQSVGVHHEGTYICTVYLPHLHAQQAMELKVVEPPTVTLRPVPLSVPPGAHAELACEVSDFYPLDASVTWRRRGSHVPQDAFLETWESGHRQSPNGTYSFTGFARLTAVQPDDHGSSYSCHVTHDGLGEAGLRKTLKLHVAGSSGPSLEDAIGCFLLAFVTLGILQALFKHALGVKTKTEKQE